MLLEDDIVGVGIGLDIPRKRGMGEARMLVPHLESEMGKNLIKRDLAEMEINKKKKTSEIDVYEQDMQGNSPFVG